RSHFGLQPSPNSLNSSGAGPVRASMTDRGFFRDSSGAGMNRIRALACGAKLLCTILCAAALPAACFAAEAPAEKLPLPPGTSAALDKIYSFDTDGAIADAQRLQKEQPEHPLG